MTSQETPPRERSMLAWLEIVGGLALLIGAIVGFVTRRTADLGGADCGSVLGGGGDKLTAVGFDACDRALSTPTTWTWILVIVGVLLLATGWIVDAIQKNGWEAARRAQHTAT